MSKVQVDKVVNLSDDGAPQLTYGAELPVGYGLTGAGGLNISGVVTAASAVFSGNVTIGGTLTYEDVTNIDVVGVSTFAGRMNVNSSALFNEGLSVTAGVTTIAGTSTYAGTATYAGDVSIADKIIHTGDTNTAIRFPSADTVTVETSGSERARIDSSGRLLLGTATANSSDRFTIVDPGNAFISLRSDAEADGNSQIIDFAIGTGDRSSSNLVSSITSAIPTGAAAGGTLKGYLAFSTNSGDSLSERVRITSSGKTGIGITNPGAELHAYHATSNTIAQFESGDAGAGVVFKDNSTYSSIEQNSTDFIISADQGATHANTALVFKVDSAEKMRVNSDGNVSIGNNPTVHSDYILHVEDTGETNIKVEGSTSTLGARISLQNNDTTANSYSQFAFNDAGGQSTSAIQGINTDQTNNYGELAFLTRSAQGSPPAERMRLDSSGRLLINQTSVGSKSATAPLQLISATTGAFGVNIAMRSQNDYGFLSFTDNDASEDLVQMGVLRSAADTGNLLFYTNGGNTSATERMRVDSAGRVLIGTTSGSSTLTVSGDIETSGDVKLTVDDEKIHLGASGDFLLFHNGSNNYVYGVNDHPTLFHTNNVETASLRRSGSHGNMYLNTTSQIETSVFSVSSNGSATIGSKVTADNTQTHIIFANGNGNVGNITTNGSATSYNTSSDYRLKENASAITDGITRLKTLKPYRFNWKSVGVGTTVDGFLAHEVTAVPEAITGTKDLVTTSSDVSAGIATAVGIPIYQGIDQSKLVPLLTAALQEAVEETESLKTLIKNSSSFAALKSSL